MSNWHISKCDPGRLTQRAMTFYLVDIKTRNQLTYTHIHPCFLATKKVADKASMVESFNSSLTSVPSQGPHRDHRAEKQMLPLKPEAGNSSLRPQLSQDLIVTGMSLCLPRRQVFKGSRALGVTGRWVPAAARCERWGSAPAVDSENSLVIQGDDTYDSYDEGKMSVCH